MEVCSNHSLTQTLNGLRELLDTHPVNSDSSDRSSAGWLVYNWAKTWIASSNICGQHLLQATNIAEKAVDVLFIHQGSEGVAVNMVCLGMYIAECVASNMVTSSIRLTGQWEKVVWTFVTHIGNWEPHFVNVISLTQSSCLKRWVLRVFNDPQTCTNFQLRLEMLRLIELYTESDLRNPFLGKQITSGLVATSVYLSVDNLIPIDGRRSLTFPFIKVLQGVQRYGYLRPVVAASLHQVGELQAGPEARCLAHLIELVGQVTEELQEMHEMGLWCRILTLSSFDSIFLLLEQLLTVMPIMEAYECPGLAQMAAATMVTTTVSVLNVASTLQDNESARCSWIISSIDDAFCALAFYDKPQSVSAVLRRDHGQTLADLSRRALDLNCPLSHLPQGNEESTEECPERFMDSLTQTVMEAPVLLTSSKMVVDESTLMHLLLVSPKDPFTRQPLEQGSYTRLPDLRADIDAWRRNSRGASHHTASCLNRSSSSEDDSDSDDDDDARYGVASCIDNSDDNNIVEDMEHLKINPDNVNSGCGSNDGNANDESSAAKVDTDTYYSYV